MKKYLLIIVLIVTSYNTYAIQISDSLAKIAALNFLNNKAVNPIGRIQNDGLNLSITVKGNSSIIGLMKQKQNYFYIFNIHDNLGFVIVAADDKTIPILAYSFNGGFDSSFLHISIREWMETYKRQMQYIIDNNVLQTEMIKNQWDELLGNKQLGKGTAQGTQTNNAVTIVGPLIKTNWNQNPYYNDLCPMDTVHKARSIAGCVATAMAHIMKYWNYPTKWKSQ